MDKPLSDAELALRDAALEYHRAPTRGKIAVNPTKPLSNQRDLSLAYSPGVAYACLAIEEDASLAADYTSRGNLVGVVTNGTAVLGLGDIGPLAGRCRSTRCESASTRGAGSSNCMGLLDDLCCARSLATATELHKT